MKKMGQKGVISYVLVFAVLFIALGFIFAILYPGLQQFHIALWSANGYILDTSNDLTNNIQDTQLKTAFSSSIQSQKDAITTNTDILGFLSQYAWFFIALIIFVIIFLKIRENVEVNTNIYG